MRHVEHRTEQNPREEAASTSSYSSLVEGHQPVTPPTDPKHPTSMAGISIDAVPGGADGPVSFDALANICRMQQQTIALLVEEKTALAAELQKCVAIADQFKSSEELLEEGRLLVDALRRQNAELEE